MLIGDQEGRYGYPKVRLLTGNGPYIIGKANFGNFSSVLSDSKTLKSFYVSCNGINVMSTFLIFYSVVMFMYLLS